MTTRISFSKATFTEETAREIRDAYPDSPIPAKIQNAANAFLRRRWDATTGERLNDKHDSFTQFAAFCRRYPRAADLAFGVNRDDDAMPLVSMEDAQ